MEEKGGKSSEQEAPAEGQTTYDLMRDRRNDGEKVFESAEELYDRGSQMAVFGNLVPA